jgi:putative phosphotransacetylase
MQAMNEKDLAKIIRETALKVLTTQNETKRSENEIPIAASNRHIHLSEVAVERLFGKGYKLQKLKDLSQPGQFAAKETVTLIGPKGKLNKVRVLGPARGDTQVEISLTDGFTIGQAPPLRDSGDIEGTPGITIQGPKGQMKIDKGLICAARHIHMHTSDAEHFKVKNGERVQVKVSGDRGLTFDNVLIRVSERYRLEMHIDIDEANAAQIKNGQLGIIQKY